MRRSTNGVALAICCAAADQLLDEGDMAGCEVWYRILNAIERLQATARTHDPLTERVAKAIVAAARTGECEPGKLRAMALRSLPH
jgi:hypothetical protein